MNTTEHERQVSLSADQLLLAYQGVGDIRLARRQSVSEPFASGEKLGAPVNTDGKNVEPNLAADGTALYFSSNRAGDLDLYTVRLEYGRPVGDAAPLTSLNTAGYDGGPVITADGLTLYFQSGELDASIWVAHRKRPDAVFDEKRGVDELDTPADESPEAISADGCTLYFATDSAGAMSLSEAKRSR